MLGGRWSVFGKEIMGAVHGALKKGRTTMINDGAEAYGTLDQYLMISASGEFRGAILASVALCSTKF